MSMRVKELLNIAETQMSESGVENPDVDSKLLYCYLRRIPKAKLILEYQVILEDYLCEEYFSLLDKRCAGIPLQYIIGRQGFMGFSFIVNEDVLIPRPDTEILVDNAVKVINENKIGDEQLPERGKGSFDVLDLGCGSGAIGVSIAKLCKTTKVTCSDISPEAVAVARKNAELNSMKIAFEEGDLFEPFKKARFRKKRFDMIISNPPYVRTGEIPYLQREIKDHEPLIALDGGDDGLKLYKRIIRQAPEFLKKDGILMFEIGAEQKDAVVEMLEKNGHYQDLHSLQDLAHFDRVVFARIKD